MCARERELGEWVSVEGERDKIFTVWSVREVKGNCQGRLVRLVGQTSQTGCPWQPGVKSKEVFFLTKDVR